MIWPAYLILGLVTVQRIAELLLAERNTRRLLARGAHEAGRRHYPFIVAIHAGWLAALWAAAPGQAIHGLALLVFALLQAARLWVIATLGERWTTRIIVLPGAPLVRRGPYRWFAHPNYLIVIAEIAMLPLVFGQLLIAVVFSVLNAVILAIRISEENRALGGPA